MRQLPFRMLFKSGITVVLMSVLTMPPAMASGEACKGIFQADEGTQNHIDKTIKDLASLRVKLDEEKASGHNSVATTALENDYQKREREIFEALVKGKIMSREELGDRLRQEIVKAQDQTGKKRLKEEKEAEDKKNEMVKALDPVNFAKIKMTFHEIRPGKFMMGKVETEITQPFEMMETQVTQMMWARLQVAMGEKDPNKINPSNFKTGTGSILASMEGVEAAMMVDHPVEMVSYKDAVEFIDGLNRLSISVDAKTQELLVKIIPGHKKGDVYDLPTEAQWEFVMRDRGNANKKYFDRDDDVDLHNYAWFLENSGGQTHAVASRQPRMIDGKPFYDLEGNVWEWNKDWYYHTLRGGADPQGAAAGTDRMISGGGYSNDSVFMGAGNRRSFPPDFRLDLFGLRLIRLKGSSL